MVYQAWKHEVLVSEVNGRWTVSVDERAFAKWYMTKAEAWEAGVREADRLERGLRGAPSITFRTLRVQAI